MKEIHPETLEGIYLLTKSTQRIIGLKTHSGIYIGLTRTATLELIEKLEDAIRSLDDANRKN